MKKWMTAVVTFAVIFAVNWLAAKLFQLHFIDVSFFTGLVFAVALRWLNSSGGFLSDAISTSVQSQTGVKMEREEKKSLPSTAAATAIVYTVLALIATIIYYLDYFM